LIASHAIRGACLTLVLSVVLAQSPAGAQSAQSWPEVKCARYKKAWTDALARRGGRGLSEDFIASHEAFLASGCTARANVCPRSAEELDLANVLTVLAMNAGTASTFLPFACRP
jgi:hypothetical protein